MLNTIHNILTQEQIDYFISAFSELDFVSGLATASSLDHTVKDNLQLAQDDPAVQALYQAYFQAVRANQVFTRYTISSRIYPPLFSRYEAGLHYGNHVDAALMNISNDKAFRTDIASTLFLSDPESYDGGELVIQLPSNELRVKLPAGSMILYPPNFVHRVEPVTKGVRYAAVTWIESMVPDNQHRQTLFELQQSTERLQNKHGLKLDDPDFLALNNTYQLLVREWSS